MTKTLVLITARMEGKRSQLRLANIFFFFLRIGWKARLCLWEFIIKMVPDRLLHPKTSGHDRRPLCCPPGAEVPLRSAFPAPPAPGPTLVSGCTRVTQSPRALPWSRPQESTRSGGSRGSPRSLKESGGARRRGAGSARPLPSLPPSFLPAPVTHPPLPAATSRQRRSQRPDPAQAALPRGHPPPSPSGRLGHGADPEGRVTPQPST